MKNLHRRILTAALLSGASFSNYTPTLGQDPSVQKTVNVLASDESSHCNSLCDADLCNPTCDSIGGKNTNQWNLFPQNGILKFHGWVDAGFLGNTQSPASRFNGPYNSVDRSNEPMFNQGYLIAETALPSNGGSWIGARMDTLYGEDYLLAQSIGMERRPSGAKHWNGHEYYGVAIPQAFAEVGSKELSVKAGHFYSPVGYEGVMSPENFFYSKSYSYQFAGPFTHWGMITTWKPNSSWQIQKGVTNGWDALDRTKDRMGVLFSAKYTSDQWWSSFAITTGDETNNLAGLPGVTAAFTNRTRASWLTGLDLTEKTKYVFHYWQGYQANALANGGNADWWGIDQYVYRQVSNQVRHGIRTEWFNDQDGTRLGLNRASNPNNAPFIGEIYSLAYGINYTPNSNLIIRPEIRADWFDRKQGGSLPFDDGTNSRQLTLGGDAVFKF